MNVLEDAKIRVLPKSPNELRGVLIYKLIVDRKMYGIEMKEKSRNYLKAL